MNKHKTSTRVPAFATTTVLVVVIVALTIAVSGLGYMQYNSLRKENKTLKDVLVNIKDTKTGSIIPVSLHITDTEIVYLLVTFGFFYKKFRFFGDRKSTRLNSSHPVISYAVFCLKKKNTI